MGKRSVDGSIDEALLGFTQMKSSKRVVNQRRFLSSFPYTNIEVALGILLT